MVIMRRPDQRQVHLHIGHACRPSGGGTLPHVCYEAVEAQTSVRHLINQENGSSTQGTGLVLVESAARHHLASEVCRTMIDDLLPRIWALIDDPDAAQATLRAWAPSPTDDLQASVVAIRWPHCLLYADGWHRLAVVRKHRARIVASNRRRLPSVHVEDLRIDDRVVMMSASMSDALPIPAIGLAAQKGLTAGGLARELVQAATDCDPDGTHAVLSLLAGAAA